MAERILNDFIEDSNFNLTKDFIQKADNFIATYKNKNVRLTNILNYIVEKDKSYSFNKDKRNIEIYNTIFTFPSYEQRKGVMIEIKTDESSVVGKYFLMKSCFEISNPDTFHLSETFSKPSSEITIVDFKKLLEDVFYVW